MSFFFFFLLLKAFQNKRESRNVRQTWFPANGKTEFFTYQNNATSYVTVQTYQIYLSQDSCEYISIKKLWKT